MIKLDEEYVIDCDKLCYILKRMWPARDKAGNLKYTRSGDLMMSEKTVGYYTRLPQALIAWSDEKDRDIVASAEMDLQEAVRKILMSREQMKRIIKQAIPEVIDH